MEAFTRGWSFLKQAWQMVFKDRDLIKPSVYSLVAGLAVSAVGLLPIVGTFILLGDSRFGNIALFVLGAILVFVQFVVSYIFSAMTVYVIYGYLAEGDGRLEKAWAIVRRDLGDIATLAAASTAVNLLRGFVNRNAKRGGAAADVARAAAGLFEALWTEAAYLVLPAMVIDDLNLKDGLARVLKITRENLLLVGISTVGVRLVTRLVAFAFGTTGLLLGAGVFFGLAPVVGSKAIGVALAIGLAVLLASIFMMTGAVISSYTSTAYHTCLYLWARDVERVRAQGKATAVAAPAPLAAVLT